MEFDFVDELIITLPNVYFRGRFGDQVFLSPFRWRSQKSVVEDDRSRKIDHGFEGGTDVWWSELLRERNVNAVNWEGSCGQLPTPARTGCHDLQTELLETVCGLELGSCLQEKFKVCLWGCVCGNVHLWISLYVFFEFFVKKKVFDQFMKN